jgi:hypothetical protein
MEAVTGGADGDPELGGHEGARQGQGLARGSPLSWPTVAVGTWPSVRWRLQYERALTHRPTARRSRPTIFG